VFLITLKEHVRYKHVNDMWLLCSPDWLQWKKGIFGSRSTDRWKNRCTV